MEILKTFQLLVDSMDFFRIADRANEKAAAEEETIRFLLTTTELEGNPQILDVTVTWTGELANPQMTCVNRSSLSYDTLRGLSQIRCNYPKSLGSGNPWQIEASATDRTDRIVQVDVLQDSDSILWAEDLTPSEYVADYNTSVLEVPEASGEMPIEDIDGLREELDSKANDAELAEVAKSGSYNDLEDHPMINGVELIGDKSFPELDLLRITNTELEEMLVV